MTFDLISFPKIKRVPLLVINNINVKFESDCAETLLCMVTTRFQRQCAKVNLDPMTLNQ